MKISSPKLPASLEVVEEPRRPLQDRERFEQLHIKGGAIEGTVAKSVAIESRRIGRLDGSGAKLKNLELLDVEIDHGMLPGLYADGASLQRVTVRDTVLTGASLSASHLTDVIITNSKLYLVNLRFTTLKSVHFIDCNLEEADFHGATLAGVSFENCELSRSDWSNAQLANVDLRSSRLVDLNGMSGLRGAIIDTAQLMSLAGLMAAEAGIEIKN